jgi:hypothetical protein
MINTLTFPQTFRISEIIFSALRNSVWNEFETYFCNMCYKEIFDMLCLPAAFTLFFPWLILRLWRWRRHVPPKRRLTFNGLHGVISRKAELFITTGVRTSNPTFEIVRPSNTHICSFGAVHTLIRSVRALTTGLATGGAAECDLHQSVLKYLHYIFSGNQPWSRWIEIQTFRKMSVSISSRATGDGSSPLFPKSHKSIPSWNGWFLWWLTELACHKSLKSNSIRSRQII